MNLHTVYPLALDPHLITPATKKPPMSHMAHMAHMAALEGLRVLPIGPVRLQAFHGFPVLGFSQFVCSCGSSLGSFFSRRILQHQQEPPPSPRTLARPTQCCLSPKPKPLQYLDSCAKVWQRPFSKSRRRQPVQSPAVAWAHSAVVVTPLASKTTWGVLLPWARGTCCASERVLLNACARH